MNQVLRVACYGLLVQDGSILLCRLKAPEPNAGKWTLPGGGLDFGEPLIDCLRRELREETGLEISEFELAGVDDIVGPFRDMMMQSIRLLYRVGKFTGELRDEADGSTDLVAWHRLDELENLPRVSLVDAGVAVLRR